MSKNILILGNGFDLNLGLKTGYCDFIRSKQFSVLKKNGSQLAHHLNEQNELQNWIDIENELKECSRNNFDELEAEYEDLCDALMDYLHSLEYPKERWPATPAYDLFDDYKKTDFLVIDFNYTPTSRMLLRHFGRSDYEIDNMLIKIHGSTETKDIIFGVEDSAKIKKDHVFLKKSYNINFRAINFKDLLRTAASVSFFGHSLGVTDFMYFKDFFGSAALGNTQSDLTFFYYGKPGYKQMFIQLDEMTNNRLSGLKQLNTITFKNSKL